MQLFPHQQGAVKKAAPILSEQKMVYLAMQVRTGKTLTALTLAKDYKTVGFITTKKAIPSIQSDYNLSGYKYNLHIINYESASKIPECDIYILDEAHKMGAFPKPGARTIALKKIINGKPCILLSGTPTPESHSQIYHQLWVTGNSPFEAATFYKWVHEGYVTTYTMKIKGFDVKQYDRANTKKIEEKINHLFVTVTQEEAEFKSDVDEEIITVPSNDITKYLYKTLEKDQVVSFKNNDIVADSPAILVNKLSQIASGTIKTENGAITFDDSKAVYIRNNFQGKRLAIYYRYIAEFELLKSVFPKHTTNWVDFENHQSDIFLSQLQSGREGISLKSADYQIMYNIDFSATTYWQVIARLQHKDKVEKSKVKWLFSDLGIEALVYKAVLAKKNFTSRYYEKQVRKQDTGFSNKAIGEKRISSPQNRALQPQWLP